MKRKEEKKISWIFMMTSQQLLLILIICYILLLSYCNALISTYQLLYVLRPNLRKRKLFISPRTRQYKQRAQPIDVFFILCASPEKF